VQYSSKGGCHDDETSPVSLPARRTPAALGGRGQDSTLVQPGRCVDEALNDNINQLIYEPLVNRDKQFNSTPSLP